MAEVAGDIFSALKSAGFTPGSYGIWILVAMAAGMWWKGLPAVLDAWSKRSDAESERIGKEIARLERQIEAGEKRHQECESRCERLQERMNEVLELLEGYRRQMAQQQISTVNMVKDEPTPIIATMIATLDRIPGGDLPPKS